VWSDNETEIDAINVQHVVGAVVDILNTPHLTPITVGVFGPWGSGKSSVAKMVQQAMAPPDGKSDAHETLVVYFNGWRFEGYEDAKAALMGTIIEEIVKHRTLSTKGKRLAKRLWRSINVMQLVKSGAQVAGHLKLAAITGSLSVPASAWMAIRGLLEEKASDATVEDASKLLNTVVGDAEKADKNKVRADDHDLARLAHRSVRNFEKHFEALLAETKLTRLVVVIDDLDRCLPAHVIDTLEAIRLFLAVKRTAFVITADEVLVQHAVRHRFPGMDALRSEVGHDYLEKMIQIPIRLPLLGRADLENYLNLLFAQRALAPERFSTLCTSLLAAVPPTAPPQTALGIGHEVPFSLDTAQALLGADYPTGLRDDLALAKQIVHVVALSVGGNPRQVKRYLNALTLRLTMATKRRVSIDTPLAAKLMLLEYFRPEAFLQLAKWQAAQRGRPREIALLERARVGAAQETPAQAVQERLGESSDSEPAVSGRRAVASTSPPVPVTSNRTSGARRSVESPEDIDGANSAQKELQEPLVPEAALWLQDDWLRAWLETEPRLAGLDLGPYFYFARDRFVARAVSTQELGPLGQTVLTGLQATAESVRLAHRDRAVGLTQPVAFAVLASLADHARSTGKPDIGEESPYAGIYDLAGWRPELGPEIVRFFTAQPVSVLRPETPARLIRATSASPAAAEAVDLAQRWAQQVENKGLAAGATAALASSSVPKRGARQTGSH
jgi:hypothetical protein